MASKIQPASEDRSSFLFICGCARSGTSALASHIGSHPEVAIGLERYIDFLAASNELPKSLFTRDRFFDVRQGDSWYDSLDLAHYAGLEDKFESARYRGDKVPRLYRHLPMLFDTYGAPKIIFIVRNVIDVAASFEVRAEKGVNWPGSRDATAAISDWNESLNEALPYVKEGRVLAVSYEDLFERYEGWDRVSDYLGLEIPVPRRRAEPSQQKVDRLSGSIKEALLSKTRIQLYRQMLDQIRGDLKPDAPGTVNPQPKLSSPAPASGPKAPIRKYHQDEPVLAYPYTPVGKASFEVRMVNGAPPPDEPLVTFVGSAATFGRFVPDPFADQLQRALNVPMANLGFGGARPETYLLEPDMLSLISRSQFLVAEAMSARGYENDVFEPVHHTTNMVRIKPAFRSSKVFSDIEGPVFVDRVWAKVFRDLPDDEASALVATNQAAYLRDFGRLMSCTRAGALLYLAQEQPPEDVNGNSYGFPHLHTRGLVSEQERFAKVTWVVSKAGVPNKLVNRHTGEPEPLMTGWADPTVNAYYPTPEMHDLAASALLPLLESQLDIVVETQ